MILVISAATCWLSCSLSPHLNPVHSAVVCQCKCVLSAWLWYVSSAVICQLTAKRPVAASSTRLVRVKLLAPTHSAFIIAHTPPSAQDDMSCHWSLLNVASVIHHQLMMKHAYMCPFSVQQLYICYLLPDSVAATPTLHDKGLATSEWCQELAHYLSNCLACTNGLGVCALAATLHRSSTAAVWLFLLAISAGEIPTQSRACTTIQVLIVWNRMWYYDMSCSHFVPEPKVQK